MTTYIGTESTWVDKIGITGVILAMLLLFVAISQPMWRGQEMLAEMRSNCEKVGGVMLENKRMLGTSYECAERKEQL